MSTICTSIRVSVPIPKMVLPNNIRMYIFWLAPSATILYPKTARKVTASKVFPGPYLSIKTPPKSGQMMFGRL